MLGVDRKVIGGKSRLKESTKKKKKGGKKQVPPNQRDGSIEA